MQKEKESPAKQSDRAAERHPGERERERERSGVLKVRTKGNPG